MANVTTQVAASKPSCPIERVKEHGLASAAGTVPQGCLVGRNAAGYFVNADDSVALTEVGLNTSPTVVVNAALGNEAYNVAVEREVLVPFKIATLGSAAAARAAYGRAVSALYNDEVQLGGGTYANWVGIIVGHNSLTEVLVEVRQLSVAEMAAELGTTREIFVDAVSGNDSKGTGTAAQPYKTFEAAWAVLSATRNQINVLPGDYTTAAVCALPAHSFYVQGIGPNGSVTLGPSAAHITAATPMFKKSAGAVAATCYFSFENITLDHGDSNIGIQIDNTTAGKKLFLSIRNVEFGGSARAIDVVTHGDTSNAVRININNGGMEIEGLVYFAVGNSSDYCRIADAILSGGFTSDATATVAEFTFRNCEVLHGGVSGGASEQVINSISCHSRTGATIAALDGSDLAGSHTENILAV